jgi:hypothetical protein
MRFSARQRGFLLNRAARNTVFFETIADCVVKLREWCTPKNVRRIGADFGSFERGDERGAAVGAVHDGFAIFGLAEGAEHY